jgi:nitrogen fixation-related uncharacterized protein
MLLNLLTLISMCVATVALIWGAFLWAKRAPEQHREDFSPEFLVGLGKGIGLDHYSERDYFGERIQVLSGQFHDLDVEMEISSGRWQPYLRITIAFPRSLAQDLNIMTDDKSSMVHQVRRMHELELGDEDFDEEFLLFARDQEHLELVLPEGTRYQMLRVLETVDELRLTDNSLFLFVDHPCDRNEIKRMLKKAVELSERLHQTAEMIGPRRPSAGAGHYEQATIEQTARGAGSAPESDGSSAAASSSDSIRTRG